MRYLNNFYTISIFYIINKQYYKVYNSFFYFYLIKVLLYFIFDELYSNKLCNEERLSVYILFYFKVIASFRF